MLIAHVSDPHLDGSDGRLRRFRAAMALVATMAPRLDAVVVSGDVVHDGTAGQYAQARETLAVMGDVPVLCCPGNRDDRSAFRAGLLGDDDGDATPVNQVRRTAGATYVLCDSTISGEPGGLLGAETLGWLETTLAGAGSDHPVVLALHHPPMLVWGQPGDGPELRDRDELMAVVRRAGNVSLLLAGHYHVALTTEVAGVPLRVAPSVGFGARTDWESPAERFDMDADPMVSLHDLGPDGGVTTVVRAVAA